MKHAIRFLIIRGFVIVLLLALLLDVPLPVTAASNGISISGLDLYPSLEVCSVILRYTGDDNHNATVNLQWRVHGTSTWKQGLAMTNDTRATVVRNEGDTSSITNAWKNQFRGVIILPLSTLNSAGTAFVPVSSITPNATYDVQVTVTDTDGVTGTNPATGTFTTWDTNPASSGSTYYVSTTGSDSNDGSASDNSHAWKTLAKAAGVVNAGATIKILPGTYSSFTVTRSGTISNYITWTSNDVNNPAVISSSDSPVTINGAKFNRFSHLTVTETNGRPCFYIQGASQRNIIEYNTLNVNYGDYWGAGVAMPDDSVSETIIRNNNFYTTSTGSDGGPFCVEMDYHHVVGTVFSDNHIYAGSGGSHTFGDSINNGLYMNGHAYRNIIDGANDDGIEFENEGICCTMWCNIITNCGASALAIAPVTVGPLYVFRNVIYGNTVGDGGGAAGLKEGYSSDGFVLFYHNTYAYRAESIVTDSADNPTRHQTNVIYRNNIFYSTYGAYVVQYNGYGDGDWDYNLMYNGSSGTSMKWFGTQYSYSAWRSAYPAQQVHGQNANPSLTSTTGDISLKSTSPCINAGTVINGFNDADSAWPYSGTAPDIGASEAASGPANNPPVAVNDAYTTSEDTALNVAATGVLGNDTDADGNTLTSAKVSDPAHGTVTLNSNGSFVYTPTANYNGTDTFTYRDNDGTANSNTATVTITITAVNDAPVAVNDAYSIVRDTVLTVAASGVLSNDTDADGNTLTAALVATVIHGTLTLNGNGSFTYTPTTGYTGTDTFTYRANDGTANSNTATVTITITAVNNAPVAVNDAYSTNEDTALTVAASGVLSNDTDADGNTLTAAKVSDPAHGTVTLNSNGSFTYTPTANYNGTDTFTYRANDGAANSNTATVTITITAVNDAPVAVNNAYTTNEDTTLTVTAPGVLSNDTDADGNPMTAANITSPAHGVLVFNANGSFTYTPTANYNGTDTFTYRANDGQANSNTATVTISITAVNDAPVAVSNAYTTNEDTALTITAPGVLGNDTDAEGSALTASKVTNPSHGTVTLNSSGSFTYTPTANYNGTDSFTYRARDGQLYSNTTTVTITVTPVNDAPMVVNNAYTGARDTVLNVSVPGVLGNDTDADGDALTAIKVTNPSHGTVTLNSNGSLAYTPSANYTGMDTFTYRANDGTANSNTATVTINITAVNRTPVTVNDGYNAYQDTVLNVSAPGVLDNDTDADGDTLTAVKISNPSHGTVTLNSNGSFIYAPVTGYAGTDNFTYRTNDGQANSNTATVIITITARVNGAPVLAAIGNKSVVEGQLLTFTVTAADPDGDILIYSVDNTPTGAAFDEDTGVFSWTPAAGQAGTFTNIRFEANDGALSDFEIISITVQAIPVPPSGGSGGGGGAAASGGSGGGAAGITSLSGSMNASGRMIEEVTASDINLKVMLLIPNGTLVKNRVGQRVTSLMITPLGQSQAANSGSVMIGQCYDIEPSGATFEVSAFLIFKNFGSDIPADISIDNLYIALLDPISLAWTDLGGSIDKSAGTITIPVQHLSTYALMAHTRPADFVVSNITLNPGEVIPGETLAASVVITNQGDLSGNYTVTLKLDGAELQTKSVALNGSSSETVSFNIISDIVGQHTISIGDKLATFAVKSPSSPAAFIVSDLTINPLSQDIGENIDLSILLKNTGDLSGTYQAILAVDDNVIETKEVTLDGDGSQTTNFKFALDTVGQHKVSIGGLVAPFEIILPPPLLPPPANNSLSKPEISGFSATPSFNPDTNKLVYAKVVYKMNQTQESLTDTGLMLTVFRDGEFLEQVPLLALSQLQPDGKTGELDYVPPKGWQIGEYAFRAELYQGENLIQDTSFEHIMATSESTTAVVSWKTMGIIIGGVLALGSVILALVLYFRRNTLRDYWK